MKPKSNEKKDKKSKKAEEKRKAKEKAKKEGEAGPYIPGMSSVKPEEQVVAQGNVVDLRVEDERRAGQEAMAAQRAQVEALARLQEDQRLRLEREEQLRLQQERLAKLAPWAKKEQEGSRTEGDQLSLAEIQRREAEREREQRAAQEVLEARGREEARWREEEERRQRAAKTINWATVSGGSGAAKVKSLAEIQAEEARVEKERQEKESASRSARQGSSGGGGVWGGSKATSWAGKIAASSPAPTPRSNGNPWNSAPAQPSTAAVVAPAGAGHSLLPSEQRQAVLHVPLFQTSMSPSSPCQGSGTPWCQSRSRGALARRPTQPWPARRTRRTRIRRWRKRPRSSRSSGRKSQRMILRTGAPGVFRACRHR